MSIRLFCAVPVPSDVAEELAELGGGLPGARWIATDDLHLTLRFIGEVDGAMHRDIASALRRIKAKPFEMTLAGVGHFPPRGEPRVVWVGADKSEQLTLLRRNVDGAVTRQGVTPDRRRWVPHVTLARLDGTSPTRLGRFISERALYRSRTFEVDAIDLWSSQLTTKGSQYHHEDQYPL